jgi:hypothetical protein
MQGTAGRGYLRHIFGNIAYFGRWRSKGSMDDHDSRGYAFHNDCVTESFGVEVGMVPPPPLDFRALGKEPV